MSEKKAPKMSELVENKRRIEATCCFCIPLKVACFTLGYLMLLMNAITIFVVVTFLIASGLLVYGYDDLEPSNWKTDETARVRGETAVYYILLNSAFLFFLSVVWLVWNICILVGLHKKRPGPIKLHMAIASVRVIYLLITLVLFVPPINYIDHIVLGCIEIGFTVYFIVVYHSYATQLARFTQSSKIFNIEAPLSSVIAVSDAHFAYPKSLDKKHLVETEKY